MGEIRCNFNLDLILKAWAFWAGGATFLGLKDSLLASRVPPGPTRLPVCRAMRTTRLLLGTTDRMGGLLPVNPVFLVGETECGVMEALRQYSGTHIKLGKRRRPVGRMVLVARVWRNHSKTQFVLENSRRRYCRYEGCTRTTVYHRNLR